ncbi:MAG: DUF6443 domain-containing protein, partial [Prevotellaceae bacterium]|nr:DUF6443 domain-containing protein [Prevotellaceae bacterium]
MKKIISSFVLLLACFSVAQSQSYIFEYHIDFNFKSGDGCRFYWDYMILTTQSGRTIKIENPTNPSKVLLYQAYGIHPVKGKKDIPVIHHSGYEAPCADGSGGVPPATPPNNGLPYYDHEQLEDLLCYYETSAYSGPVKKIVFTQLVRQTWNHVVFGTGFWDTACKSDKNIYETNVEKHSFDIKLNNSHFPCLAFSTNTITPYYFRMKPNITIRANNNTVSANLDFSTLTQFSSVDGFPAVVYRWQYGFKQGNDTTWHEFPAAYQGKANFSANGPDILGESLFLANAGKTMYVRMFFNPLESNNRLTFDLTGPPLKPGSIKPSDTINMFMPGTVPGHILSTEPASGGSGTYTYTWEMAPMVSGTTSFVTVASGSPEHYKPPALTQSSSFRRTVYDGRHSLSTSSVDFIIMSELTSGSISLAAGAPAAILAGKQPGLIVSSATPTGCYENYTYSWQYSTDNGNSWDDAPGINDMAKYQPDTLGVTTCFHRLVYATCLNNSAVAISNEVCITVYPPVSVELIDPLEEEVFVQNSNTSPPLQAVASGGDGNYSYQWTSSTDNLHWTAVGSNTDTYYPDVSTAGTYYYRCAVSSFHSFAVSRTIKKMVYPYMKGGIIGRGQEIIEQHRPDAFVSFVEADSLYCSGAVYQWEYTDSPDNNGHNVWTVITGATASTCQPDTLTVTTLYRRGADCGGNMEYSNELTVTVYPPLLAVPHLNDNPDYCDLPVQLVHAGNAPQPIYARATGGNGIYDCQWEQRALCDTCSHWVPVETHRDGITLLFIDGLNGSTYTPPPLQDTTFYRCKISSLNQTVYSETITVFVYTSLIAGTIGDDQHVLPGQTPALLTNISSPSGGMCTNYRYQWQYKTFFGKWTNIDGADSLNYQPGILTRASWFRRQARLACMAGEPELEWSNEVCIVISGQIEADQLIAKGGQLNPLFGIYQATDEPINYQWQDSTAGVWSNIPGANESYFLPAGINNIPGSYYYRRLIITLNEVFYSNVVNITVTEGPAGLDYYDTTGDYPVNYTVLCAPFTAVQNVADMSLTQQKQASVINYTDGLGRPLQTVLPMHTPEGKDLVQWSTYDEMGREHRSYLPYAKTPAAGKAGGFTPIADAIAAQQQYYQQLHGTKGERTFSEITYETSPLSRVAQQMGPGKAWVDAIRSVSYDYRTNTQAIGSWKVVASGAYQPLIYLPGTLVITDVNNENNVTASVYKDRQGRLIMEEEGEQQTRYVYDVFDRKTVVLPPGIPAPDENTCFMYRYDKRGRLTGTKTPGAGWVYAVYDKNNRRVMSQDANQREVKRWTLQRYDRLNRPARTLELQFTLDFTQEGMQERYNNSAALPYTDSTLLSEVFY